MFLKLIPNLKVNFLQVRPETQDEETFGLRSVCRIID